MRLIDAEALKAVLRNHIDALRRNIEYGGAREAEAAFWRKTGLENALDCITMADTIDAEPVRHGRWVHRRVHDEFSYKDCFRCSECRLTLDYESNYCPICGAKMDGGEASEAD